MIIGIDINSIPYGTGVSNYTLNLVKNILRVDKNNIYKLFFSSRGLPFPPEIQKFVNFPNVEIFYYRLPIKFFEIFWNKLRIFPIEMFIGKCDLFHTSDWTQPPTIKAKTITTIHDLAPFINPQWHNPHVVKVHQAKLYWAIKQCSRFICVSENTRQDLLRIFPKINPDLTSVIYEAAESKYHQFRHLPTSERNKKIDLFKNHYELGTYFLAQGTREPRKNLSRLIEAFEIFSQTYQGSDIQLAIAGKYGWGEDIKKKNPNIRLLGYVREQDMVALHAGALALVYPSLYEGFGLPLVKSLKVGVPVITSNISSLPEIVTDAAILIDPYSVDSIAKALQSIYSDQNLRQKLIKNGFKISPKYNWLKTARKTLKIYHQTYNQ